MQRREPAETIRPIGNEAFGAVEHVAHLGDLRHVPLASIRINASLHIETPGTAEPVPLRVTWATSHL